MAVGWPEHVRRHLSGCTNRGAVAATATTACRYGKLLRGKRSEGGCRTRLVANGIRRVWAWPRSRAPVIVRGIDHIPREVLQPTVDRGIDYCVGKYVVACNRSGRAD